MMPVRHRTFFPPSPPASPEHRHFACTPSGHVVRCEFSRLQTCWAHRPSGLCSGAERLAQWEVVSSYSSATAPDSHGISCADPLFQARKELDRGVAACASRFKIYLLTWQFLLSCRASVETSLVVTNQRFLDFARNDKKPTLQDLI